MVQKYNFLNFMKHRFHRLHRLKAVSKSVESVQSVLVFFIKRQFHNFRQNVIFSNSNVNIAI